MLSRALAASVDSGRHDLIVTSTRRLSRAIERHCATRALDAGEKAWSVTPVLPWGAWLRRLATDRLLLDPAAAAPMQLLPPAAARALWREAATAVLPARAGFSLGTSGLATLAAASYALMRRYDLALDDIADEAWDEDSRFFVDAARHVRRRLEARSWLLEADLAAALAPSGALLAPSIGARVLLAGFDALTPDQRRLTEALAPVVFETPDDAPTPFAATSVTCATFRDEIVAAGRWARSLRAAQPGARIAVVVPGLAGMPDDARRWFRQGFAPPAAGSADAERDRVGFELSYGRPLRGYPAVATALALIDFALRPKRFTDLSRLLRSPVLTPPGDARPLGLEHRLREHADRPWPAAALADFAGALSPGWLAPIVALAEAADERRTPVAWAERLAEALSAAGWLESLTTDSTVFQLRRAFQGALNALGGMATAAGRVTLATAVAALDDIVAETVFQPEGDVADVLVCGPLEMAGLGFDAVWVAGLDASRWPAPGRADPLLPRKLQRRHELPDATPEQTEAFWRRRFASLANAASVQVLSHAQREGDGELLRSPMLDGLETTQDDGLADGTLGWCEIAGSLPVRRVPETLSGFPPSRRLYRATTALPLLASDPFAAMALGRWHVDWLEDPRREVTPRQRGIVVHDALRRVYGSLNTRDRIAGMDRDERNALVRQQLAASMAREFVHADGVLRELLRIEEARAAALIDALLDADAERPPFDVVAREQDRTLVLSGITLKLKLDRVDRTPHGSLIIDYKTGAKLSLTVDAVHHRHFQLLVYALTEQDRVAGIALAGLNRDAHRYSALLDHAAGDSLPAGRTVRRLDMSAEVEAWRADATGLAARFLMAPVDIGRHPAHSELNWLSRHAEALRDDS